MLEQYEQKLLLEMLINLLNNCSLNIDNEIYAIRKILKKACLCTNDEIKELNKDNLLKELQKLYSKFEKNYEKSQTQLFIDNLAKLYHIDKNQADVFCLYIRFNLPMVYNIMLSFGLSDMATYTDITNKNFSELSDIQNSLLQKGIDIYSFHERLYFSLYNDLQDKSSFEELSNLFFGEKLTTSLEKKDFMHLSQELSTCVKLIKKATKNKSKGINILLYGSPGTGKTEFAKLISKLSKNNLFEVDCKNRYEEAISFNKRISLFLTKSYSLGYSRNNFLLFDEADNITEYKTRDGYKIEFTKLFVNKVLENTPIPIIWIVNDIYKIDEAFIRRMTYSVKFNKLDKTTQSKIWKKELKRYELDIPSSKIKEICNNYKIATSVLKNAIQATNLIGGNGETLEDFVASVSTAINYGENTTKKTKKNTKGALKYYSNLINTDLDVENLTKRIIQTKKLNFSLCLYGQPGTGKSEYAKHLAKTLGIDIVTKKASEILDMYVGGTEENIANAFSEAKKKKAMLIFDEADTFLQNRNSVQRRWEISQVNEMLTQMEDFEYPFVCTTNLFDTLDEASLRRFTFKIKFDFLTPTQIKDSFKLFFKQTISDDESNIKGLTVGDFATVKKKNEFLGYKDKKEIIDLLIQETEVKHCEELKKTIGF